MISFCLKESPDVIMGAKGDNIVVLKSTSEVKFPIFILEHRDLSM